MFTDSHLFDDISRTILIIQKMVYKNGLWQKKFLTIFDIRWWIRKLFITRCWIKMICRKISFNLTFNFFIQFSYIPWNDNDTILDNLFYKNVVTRNKIVLITDAHLINDTRTISIVQKMVNENGLWQKKFVVINSSIKIHKLFFSFSLVFRLFIQN